MNGRVVSKTWGAAVSLLVGLEVLKGCSSPERPPFFALTGGSAMAGEHSATDGEVDEPGGAGRATGGKSSSPGGSAGAWSGGTGGQSAGGGGNGGSSEGGGTLGAGGARATCDADPCDLVWPLRGNVARDWIVSNYVDRAPEVGQLDYRGGDRTYDGHQGVDIAIASFRVMDQGVPAFAAAPGVVTAVHDGEADRNTVDDPGRCNLVANSVFIQQPDGREARYLHFRKDSLLVEVGQSIRAGDQLGLVGSSGCSQSPHLHFELAEGPAGEVIDPFFDELWLDPPDYDVAPDLMEVVLVSGPISSTTDVQTAPPSPSAIPAGTLGISLITGGAQPGVSEAIRFYESGIPRVDLYPYEFVGFELHYMRWWNLTLSPGNWRAEVTLGGEVVANVEFQQQ